MNQPVKRQPIPFGKYLLLDRINIGGMAEVWRGKTFGAGGFERLVAIKRILPNIAEDEEFISMFIDEAKITVQLNHANIAQIYELANISNSYFIAMEYISGKDMRAVFDRCRKRGEPAPIPLTCYLIAKCCEGLDYAHRNKDRAGRDMNIVHRDVSPQNALISYDGEVKVIDFGIAKAAGKATKTQAGILKGKFGYMSPEQIRGLPLDRRSDVFAIGICLYEMLTGERLFVGDSDFSVLEKVRKVEVLPPSHFNRRIPDSLEKIVMKALAKDVEDRYQYASEVADDLQRFLVTTEAVFGRKDLAAFMKATFAEEVEKEKQRLQEYADIKPPDGMIAAANAGFGMGLMPGPAAGAVPVLSGPADASSASISVSISTGTGQMPTSQMPTTLGPPQIAPGKPGPPVLSPGAPVVPPSRLSSNITTEPGPPPAVLPKLTAAPATTANGKEEHAATQVVDSATPFDPERTSPGDQAVPVPFRPNDVPTDPNRPPVNRGALGLDPPNAPLDVELAPTYASPSGARVNPSGPPVLMPATEIARRPKNMRVPTPPEPSAVDLPALQPDDSNPPVPPPPAYSPRMAPPERAYANTGERQRYSPPPAQGGGGLVIAAVVAVIVALAVGLLVFSGKLRGPQGLLMLDAPTDLNGQELRVTANGKETPVKVRVNINGKELTEADGKGGERPGITEWPQLRSVPAGNVTVMVVAPGYKPYTSKVVVKEGDEMTRITPTLEKKEPAPKTEP